ncbi:MAG: protein phosphatase 2C domain-containing protein [Candidatus Accumulibacter sp.]|nr:protein phosphatase 2C domain-containing protein [Accumulibacter sp.]
MKFTIYQESRPGKRQNNEDRVAYCYSRNALLMVIADGMGGHFYGEVASQIAVQTLVEAFKREARPRIRDPFLFLQKGVLNAHYAIGDFTQTRRLNDSPRTTCVACIVQDNIAYWAHVGDSRLYFLRGGRILHKTRDHSRLQQLMEKGLINERQAAIHPERNKIYSCLGGPARPEIDFSRKTPLESGDIMLLCTDGVWGVLSDRSILSAVRAGDLRRSVPELFDRVEEKGGAGADNFSVVAVRWEESYVDLSLDDTSFISTLAMNRDFVTTKLDIFGQDPNYKAELTNEEIERAVAEIHAAIQKYSK